MSGQRLFSQELLMPQTKLIRTLVLVELLLEIVLVKSTYRAKHIIRWSDLLLELLMLLLNLQLCLLLLLLLQKRSLLSPSFQLLSEVFLILFPLFLLFHAYAPLFRLLFTDLRCFLHFFFFFALFFSLSLLDFLLEIAGFGVRFVLQSLQIKTL